MKSLVNSISIILGIAGTSVALNGQLEAASFCLLLAIYLDGRLFLYKE